MTQSQRKMQEICLRVMNYYSWKAPEYRRAQAILRHYAVLERRTARLYKMAHEHDRLSRVTKAIDINYTRAKQMVSWIPHKDPTLCSNRRPATLRFLKILLP